jgi:hypothetical protein
MIRQTEFRTAGRDDADRLPTRRPNRFGSGRAGSRAPARRSCQVVRKRTGDGHLGSAGIFEAPPTADTSAGEA